MEVKKSQKADLENKKTLFMEIGMVVSLALVIIIFSVSQREKLIEIMDTGGLGDEVEVIDVTTENQPETTPEIQQQTVSVATDILNVVRNDTKITTKIEFSSFEDENIVLKPIEIKNEEIEEETVFLTADKMATFQGGGLDKFRNWVQARLTYPELARDNNIQGTVTVSFVVEKTGAVSKIKILATPDATLSDEAIKVISKSPKWEPARQRDVPVRLSYTMPIVFKLQN